MLFVAGLATEQLEFIFAEATTMSTNQMSKLKKKYVN